MKVKRSDTEVVIPLSARSRLSYYAACQHSGYPRESIPRDLFKLKQMIKTTLILFAITFSAVTALAQGGNDRPLITVVGQAEILVVPDEVAFNLQVVSMDKDLLAAQAKNDQIVKNLLALARQYQIPAAQVQTDHIRVSQRYTDEDVTRKPPVFLGYTVSKKVALVLRDVSKAEPLLADIFKSGVTGIEDVEFRTTQIRKYKDQARALAIKAAQEKANALAREIGQTIGKAYTIEEEGQSFSGLANNSGRAGLVSGSYSDDEGTIALGQISVSARVRVSFDLK